MSIYAQKRDRAGPLRLRISGRSCASPRKAFASLVPQQYVLLQAFVPKKSWFMVLALALFCAGCASSFRQQSFSRPFVFAHDTFAYANELVWEYEFNDVTVKATHHTRVPPPDYTHHCFVVARPAKQFFQNARFDPTQARAGEKTYRDAVRRGLSVSPPKALPDDQR